MHDNDTPAIENRLTSAAPTSATNQNPVCANDYGVTTLYRDRSPRFLSDIARLDVNPAYAPPYAHALRIVAMKGKRLDMAPLDLPVILVVRAGDTAERDAAALDAKLQQQEANGFPAAYHVHDPKQSGRAVPEWELWCGGGIIVQLAARL